jgi:hypothetical protein
VAAGRGEAAGSKWAGLVIFPFEISALEKILDVRAGLARNVLCLTSERSGKLAGPSG